MISLKAVRHEWFQDYKKPSMYLAFPTCTFKCERECGKRVCQNGTLASAPTFEIENNTLCESYIKNPITKAVVCGGLEPMDSFEDLYGFILALRRDFSVDDDVVIYTGYTFDECVKRGWFDRLSVFKNIIVKVGRFVPNKKKHFDEILGTYLASDNQYAVVINNEAQ